METHEVLTQPVAVCAGAASSHGKYRFDEVVRHNSLEVATNGKSLAACLVPPREPGRDPNMLGVLGAALRAEPEIVLQFDPDLLFDLILAAKLCIRDDDIFENPKIEFRISKGKDKPLVLFAGETKAKMVGLLMPLTMEKPLDDSEIKKNMQ